MTQYCDGDAASFRTLYALLAPRLLGYLVRMTRDRSVAEDLLQQTFAKVHKARTFGLSSCHCSRSFPRHDAT